MTGFILAAGFGTRLRPITNHMPKALVSVGGVPMLKRMLDDFVEAEFTSLGANTHFRPDDIAEFCSQYNHAIDLFHEKGEIRGTGGALYFAKEFLAKEECFCIRNVDIISSVDLLAVKEYFVSSAADCMLIAAPANGPGTICMENSTTGRYLGLPKEMKTESGHKIVDYIGLSFYNRRFLSFVEEGDFSLVPVWKRAADNGLTVLVHEVENMYWRDIGTPASLAQIHFDMLDKKALLPVPCNYVLDYDRKVAYCKEIEHQKDVLGPYCWCDATSVSVQSKYEQCLIWSDSPEREKKHFRIISTPWGDIKF